MAKKKVVDLSKNWSESMKNAKPPVPKKEKYTEDQQIMMQLSQNVRWQTSAIFFAVIGVIAGLVGQYQANQWLQYSSIACLFIGVICYFIFAKKRNEIIIERELKRKEEKDKK